MTQNPHKIIPTSQGCLILPGRPTSPSPKSKAGAKALTPKLYIFDVCSYPTNEATICNKHHATKFNKSQTWVFENELGQKRWHRTSNLKTGRVDIMGYDVMDIRCLYLTENFTVPFHDLSLLNSKAIFGLPPMRRICELSTEDFEDRKLLSLCRSDCFLQVVKMANVTKRCWNRMWGAPFNVTKSPSAAGNKVCVCVWNIWTDVKLLIRIVTAGGQWISFHPLPNEDGGLRLWYRDWSSRRTCNFDIASGQAQNRTWTFRMDLLSARLSQSDDYFFIGYLDHYLRTSVHFRMLNSGCTISIWALFYLSHLHLGNSDDYFEEDSLVSKTSMIMFARDSVPYRSYDGSLFV